MLTREDDVDAHALRRQGWTISAIARHLGHDRKTIRAYLTGGRVAGQRAPAVDDPLVSFVPWLRQRLTDDPHVWGTFWAARRARGRAARCTLARLDRPARCLDSAAPRERWHRPVPLVQALLPSCRATSPPGWERTSCFRAPTGRRRQLPLSAGAWMSGPSPMPRPSSTKASGSLVAGTASGGTSMSASRSAGPMSVFWTVGSGCCVISRSYPRLVRFLRAEALVDS